MVNREYIITFLQKHKIFLQQSFGVKRIALFGSFAREEEHSRSDIDIVVDMTPSFEKFFGLKRFLEENFQRNVDLQLEKSMRRYIRKKIQKDMIYVE